MARTTKLELQQAINALGEELKALRAEVSGLRTDNTRLAAENAALRDQLMDAASVMQTGDEQELADAAQAVSRAAAAPATNPVANIRGRYVKNLGIRPAWQPSAAMQAARELAMRMGCVVRVG